MSQEEFPGEWAALLNAVNQAYFEYDNDRILLERSLKISSEEMVDVMEDLKKEKEKAHLLRKIAEKAAKAKTEFFTNISHELRTPLHAIISFSALGEKKMDQVSTEKLRGYFQNIYNSGKSLLEMLNELLDIAKIDSGKMKFNFSSYDLRQLTAEVANEFASLAADKKVQLKVPNFIWPLNVTIDGEKIKQVIRNLVHNAIKYSPVGKIVEVSVKVRRRQALLMVSDQGPGIPEQELEKIFEEFEQSSVAKPRDGGTGLGLAISKKIITAHQGKLWAKNNFFGGANFSFSIPLKRKSTEDYHGNN